MIDETIRARAKKKYLRVTFPDGEVICYKNATSTMIATLNKIGVDKFPFIKQEMCHLPLLSREIYPKYKKDMKPICPGWYLNAQSNSDGKFMQLKAINDQLGLGLKIELGDDFETQAEPEKEKRSKSRDKLVVNMPNGKCIATNSSFETFVEVIRLWGVEEIRKKALLWGGKPLVTTTKTLNSQMQVDSDKWVIVPNTTRDKVKLLRVIGAMLHVNLEISVK